MKKYLKRRGQKQSELGISFLIGKEGIVYHKGRLFKNLFRLVDGKPTYS